MAFVVYSPSTSPAPPSPFHLRSTFSNDTPSSSSSLLSNLRLPLPRNYGRSCTSCRSIGRFKIMCLLAKAREPSSSSQDNFFKEPHKYFDQVMITVRSGDGGHGAVLNLPDEKSSTKSQGKNDKGKSKRKISYKRDNDGSLILPMGGRGGDVVIYADENLDTLLEFHKQSRYNAKRGGNVAAMGVLTRRLQDGLASPTLRIPVPVGTVVKRKRGKLLADLAIPGDEVLVARGGQGGVSLLDVPEHRRKKMMDSTASLLRDDSDKVLLFGQQGEEIRLELILRVVADVGLVGLPNAGKSTLLGAITHAKPEIADYPFTTLMPNLGRLDGDPTLGAGMFSSETTLADLPGLIEGAHLGKGLGRNFLRHLRRTRLLVHVVDAAAHDPVKDYITVKEELRMYNPEYLERPYLVVLNKIDLPEARERLPYLTEEIMKIGLDEVDGELERGSRDTFQPSFTENERSIALPSFPSEQNEREKEIEDYPRPLAVVGVSVLKGIHVSEMLKEIRIALRKVLDTTQQLPTTPPSPPTTTTQCIQQLPTEQILEQPQM